MLCAHFTFTRTLVLASVATLLSSVAVAQCPVDDAFEPNDDCASAMPGTVGLTSGLVVSDVSTDSWSYTIPFGQAIRVTMVSDPLQADIDLTLYGNTNCSTGVAGASTLSGTERLDFVNETAGDRDVVLLVWMFSGTCGDYSLEVELVPNPCVGAVDDSLEPNDTCALAVAPGPSPVTGLYVNDSRPDHFAFIIPPESSLTVRTSHSLSFDALSLRLINGGDCATTILNSLFGTGGVTDLSWSNNTANPVPVVLQVNLGLSTLFSCQSNYTLEWTVGPGVCAAFPGDSFEPNNDCASAGAIAPGFHPALTVRKPLSDVDWYEISVPPNSAMTAEALFSQVAGDVDLELYSVCGGALLVEGVTISDNELVTYTNATASAATVFLHAFIWPGDPNPCTNYDLDIEIQPIGTAYSTFCFGDGSGAQCPCGNNSSAGHSGGCAHSFGDGAILLPFGSTSVSNDGLSFDLASGSLSTFGLLVSGDNQLPQMGGCVGCGIPAFDGFRCAGGNFQRHGTRAIISDGTTLSSWGSATGTSLVAQGGFVAGQARNFFVFYRTQVSTGCGTGQNSSNGVQVTFAP